MAHSFISRTCLWNYLTPAVYGNRSVPWTMSCFLRFFTGWRFPGHCIAKRSHFWLSGVLLTAAEWYQKTFSLPLGEREVCAWERLLVRANKGSLNCSSPRCVDILSWVGTAKYACLVVSFHLISIHCQPLDWHCLSLFIVFIAVCHCLPLLSVAQRLS